ncbi:MULTISPECIES: helix-hairpin-helix domain-containing protein [unclassified Halorhodospira]|uniref:helix-hairpin-helix domain-containing protein n=1 Tax=unclassified Halorhodospira TaxID=2626748 RepID=UPI001EE80396|nr:MULTISPECIES: hypothetical protein [unclassified Halorhodospira]MCG5539665.1 hypothetical protein [Halorhodospira sp. M39old]MCG5545475.1 hypothetical protein [Halorhodospira sp. M38]
MHDDATTIVPFRGGALERAAWDRLWDAADSGCVRRALGERRVRYHRRVEQEMAAFARLGLEPGVLLELSWVVQDLAARGVTFGAGYGPQSGSLLLNLLGLNGIDPIDHGLPFLGFGRELEARRLHLRVASRAEQAELTSALRRGGPAPADAPEQGIEVVVGHEPTLALTREMARLARALNGGRDCDPLRWAYPWDDPDTLRLIARGETAGIPLLEGAELQARLREAAPRSLEEVTQVVVVARDGAPQGLTERYRAARTGATRPPLPHPELEDILNPTANVWLYREQVIVALARLLGCELAEAVTLAQRLSEEGADAHEGELSRQLGERIATQCQLPHARGLYLLRTLRQALAQVVDRAAALIEITEAYRQAYYRARYPAVFQAARLNRALQRITPRNGVRYGAGGGPEGVACPHREALVDLCREALSDGVIVLPPDINRSDWGFRPLDRDTVLFGLGAVAQIDRQTAERLVLRRRGGEYRSVMDLIIRGFGGTAPAQQIEPLIFSGALDPFGRDRWRLRRELDEARVGRGWQYAADGWASSSVPGGLDAWGGVDPGEGWAFQRELDVLACVPSRQYFPEAASAEQRLRPVR